MVPEILRQPVPEDLRLLAERIRQDDPGHRERLVNGSDHPLPGLDPLISTRWLVRRGFLPDADRKPLDEIHDRIPLLFDFVVTRRVSVEREDRTHLLAPSVFETAWLFRRSDKQG